VIRGYVFDAYGTGLVPDFTISRLDQLPL